MNVYLDSTDERDWDEFAHCVVDAVGGTELLRLIPDTGKPAPGSYGEYLRNTHHVVSRREYLMQIALRLKALASDGLREDFLIRSLRDEVTRHCHALANTEASNTKRSETQAMLLRMANDPERRSVLQETARKSSSKFSTMSEDQIAQELAHMAARFGPMSRETEVRLWDLPRRWHARVDALISNAICEEWLDQRAEQILTVSQADPA